MMFRTSVERMNTLIEQIDNLDRQGRTLEEYQPIEDSFEKEEAIDCIRLLLNQIEELQQK